MLASIGTLLKHGALTFSWNPRDDTLWMAYCGTANQNTDRALPRPCPLIFAGLRRKSETRLVVSPFRECIPSQFRRCIGRKIHAKDLVEVQLGGAGGNTLNGWRRKQKAKHTHRGSSGIASCHYKRGRGSDQLNVTLQREPARQN